MNVYHCSKCKRFIESSEHQNGDVITHENGVTTYDIEAHGEQGETYKYTHKICMKNESN